MRSARQIGNNRAYVERGEGVDILSNRGEGAWKSKTDRSVNQATDPPESDAAERLGHLFRWLLISQISICLLFSFNLYAQTCTDDDTIVWVDEVNSPTEGGEFRVKLARQDPLVSHRLFVNLRFKYVNDSPSFSLFTVDLPETRGRWFSPGLATTTITYQTNDNDIVHRDFEIEASLVEGSQYCIPDTTDRPAKRSGEIKDNDKYSLFVELAANQASTISEAGSIDLLFKRCVLASDDSVVCTDSGERRRCRRTRPIDVSLL